ncbi:MAG TPA: hypothetical protein VES59_01510 [Bacteroidota bacterium]|nr:hypothetical protein [Bacteroidota bacterium]
MKSFMLALALLLFIGLTQVVFAQTEGEALITASVENALTVVPVDGDWGILSPGTIYTITPGGLKNPPGPGEGTGIVVGPVGFEIDGSAGSNVVVTLALPPQLVSDDGNGGIPSVNWMFGWNFDNDATLPFAGSGPVVSNAVTLTISGTGASGLFLGATLRVPETAFAGTYTGQVIASAAYTGN